MSTPQCDMFPRCDYDTAGCKPAQNIARGKARGTSAATPGMRMSIVLVRVAKVVCTEAQHLTDAKGAKQQLML